MIHISNLPLPPTTNHAYVAMRGGGRRLSDEGRAYKAQVRIRLQARHRKEMASLQTDVAYGMRICLYMSNLRNAGYPKSAKNRYKTVDVSNRIKLLEDAFAEAGGFDDSQIFSLTVEKVESDQEYCEIYLWEIPPKPSEPHAPTASQ